MTGSCEYCGAPVADAEAFFRNGMMPCCPGCANQPLWRGIAWLVVTVATLGLGVSIFLAFK